jgi:glucosamine--fructose-6-phosphate aminotransferase (isomerizing)
VEVCRRLASVDVLAVSCRDGSALSALATATLVAHHAQEHSVVMTRSFTSMLLLVQAMAAMASGRTECLEQLSALPLLAARITKASTALAERLGRDTSIERFVFLGSGANYGLACEAMLKLQEMSRTPAEALHFLELRHGPKAMLGPNVQVVGLVSETGRAAEADVLAEARELGARVAAVADSTSGLPTDEVVALDTGLVDLACGPLMMPFLQLLAYERAVSRGLDPDQPVNLQSVVRL